MSVQKPHKPQKPQKPTQPRQPSGQVAFDDRGNATWQWHHLGESPGATLDTGELKAIAADLSVEGERAPTHAPHDPYDRAAPSPVQGGSKKRSIDDLRRLSEEIKAAPHWKDHRSR